ncbi:MAG: T9SS type A sorting domain-containing protein [candidate division WOR-3 bacterium]|nr:MAG: T9SS type A sorting domain-containing protein [candidate division WOR-3 bacterium]
MKRMSIILTVITLCFAQFPSRTEDIAKELENRISLPPIGSQVTDHARFSIHKKAELELGDVVFALGVQVITGDRNCLGVEFDGTYFYVTGDANFGYPKKVYVIDTTGTLIWTLDQPAHCTNWGWRDLAWDGTYAGPDRIDTLFASDDPNVDKFGIDLATGTLNYYGSYPGPVNPNRALAWDRDGAWFFTANLMSPCYKFSKTNPNIESVANSYFIYGSAYDTDATEGGWIWWHSQDDPGTGLLLEIEQFDPVEMSFTGLNFGYIPPQIYYGYAGGLCFYEGFRGMDVLFAVVQGLRDLIVGIFVRHDASPAIDAVIDIDPNTLNLKSQGRWVTCYIELAEGYTVEDIDINTVALTEIDGQSIGPLNREGPTEIDDYDNDGIPDLMVKFNRQALIAILSELVEPPVDVELTVSGELTDGTAFNGSDIIHVICPGSGPQTVRQGNFPNCATLYENQPNPVSSATVISYALPTRVRIKLTIYDASGRVVKTLVHDEKEAGYHTVNWDGRDGFGHELPNGIYFYKLEARDFTEMKKMVLIR